jgi:predicted AAA+ superfamily ATPase
MRNILIEQNPHWQGKKYNSIKREALSKLISYLPLKQIITVTGIRRCGKSTLVKQAINHLIDNDINPKNIFFLNLEHPYFLDYKNNPDYLNTIYEEYLTLVNPKGKVYCIFDEIQFFNNWQVFIKNKYETSEIKFIITGSNSSMLFNELNTMLSGRSLNISLKSFNFKEFLEYKQIPHKDEFDLLTYKIEITQAKEEYLKWGGFYEVFSTDDKLIKEELLISYAKNIIYQDIIPRYNIRNTLSFERLFFYLLSLSGGILNYSSLAKTFDISDKTIKEYINYFEDVFLFKRIDRYHTKQKEQIKSTKKIYTLDNGFLQIALKHSANNGMLLENAVFNILYTQNQNLTYLKDKYEIDFHINKNMFQVSYDIENEKTLKRELNSFKHFDFGAKKCLITYNTNKNFDDIKAISFERFALQQENIC